MTVGRILILVGVLFILSGTMFMLFPKLFNWFGHLPGDIRIERGNSHVFIPLGSMILVSIILTILFNIISWLIAFISKLK